MKRDIVPVRDHEFVPPDTNRDDICKGLNVSRETQDRLEGYVEILTTWQAKINLISSHTLPQIWHRHILDCAQLIRFLPSHPVKIMDVGSGAGLPGVILAILTSHNIHLVESDSRKIAFLRTALRKVGAKATLHHARIEALPFLEIDIITARAVAPIEKLMILTKAQHHHRLQYLFLKGRTAKQELTPLPNCRKLAVELHPSVTDKQAAIIHLKPNII